MERTENLQSKPISYNTLHSEGKPGEIEKDEAALRLLFAKLDGREKNNVYKEEYDKGWRIHHFSPQLNKSYLAWCLEQHYGEGVFQSDYFCVSEKALKEKIIMDGKEMYVYEAIAGNKNKLNRLIDNYSENGMFNLEIKDKEICEFIIKLGNKELQRAFQIGNKMEVTPEEVKDDEKLDGDDKKEGEEKKLIE